MKPVEHALWHLSATELNSLVKDRQVSVLEVVESHIQRIEAINPKLNAVVYPMFDDARRRAAMLDNPSAADTNSPLHGVPITIKECFAIEGGISTLGNTAPHVTHPKDGPLIDRLRKSGAVVLGMTNVPQLMVIHETRNPNYGTTRNPWNPNRSVGGSSGGEAAIIAGGGSPLGLGNDLGGSIRLPAHFCGINGLKPTSRRFTRDGSLATLRGMSWLEFQNGPMARHVADLRLAMQVLARGENRWSWNGAEEVPLAWQEKTPSEVASLRIGVFTEDGYFPTFPAIKRAIESGVAGLQHLGATIVPLEPPRTKELLKHYFAIASADGGRDFSRLTASSRVDPEVARLIRLAKLPRWLRPLIAALLLRPLGKHRLADIFRTSGPRSADSLWQVTHAAAAEVRKLFSVWDSADIDVVVCPVHATVAMPPDAAVDMLPAASYSIVMNLLGTPCGTVAATRVQTNEQSTRPPGRDHTDRLASQSEQESAGLPIGVQVVGRHWREDQVLDVMQALEAIYRQSPTYPSLSALPPIT